MKKKSRIDEYLHDNFNLGTLEAVRRIIMAGKVLNSNQPVYKPSEMIDISKADIRFKNIKPYVSRGGVKLDYALKAFGIDLDSSIVTDIGSSTGGFTDCSLQKGAIHVYAVDVGTNQLDYRLRTDARVTVMEQTNFKDTKVADFPMLPDVLTIDVSFTSIVPILRHITELFDHEYEVIALIKPQFESYLEEREESGIITSKATHENVIRRVLEACSSIGLHGTGLDRSPITGTKGNIEYLLHLTSSDISATAVQEKDIQQIVYG
ncbi:TlyA family RNA methyltransferase [Salinicoccus sp. ID82-1]|uniref:TlyA family RNA methyltransferase n=1 Tax=Salinicoccus cyprini TaxID=2493691 RepID=A0A558AZ00_9STAP|nr:MULTISPECIES: TlyA family RNA methyltransferase [Salinicoccus]MCG1009043.1 TlyA family RNA methyltransferase [Salinicoccus sp. ID82-1]TVT29491.1 TlyA family RNA methyltransferase [Salinicoccus cyprini]